MAIDTTNKKLAIIVFVRTTDPAHLPLSPGALGQDDKQQLLWGYPGVLWGAAVMAAIEDFIYETQQRWHRR